MRKGYLISVVSSFIGGIISVSFVFLTLPTGYLSPVIGEVAAISGIGSTILLTLMLLVTAALTISGSLVGTFIAKNTGSVGKRT
ncbi:MAG: hypothetical protein ACP5UZ_07350 [Thermoplasmata archaeon]